MAEGAKDEQGPAPHGHRNYEPVRISEVQKTLGKFTARPRSCSGSLSNSYPILSLI
jgi:hypothetical protein